MTAVLFGCVYLMILIFVIACIARAVSYASKPVHLRWELYPVPHEEAQRVRHGGSYFEALDWWTRPVHFNLAGELKFMVPEMLFLKGLWEFNRRLWYRSFCFHFGLYLLIATVSLILLTAALSVVAPALAAGALATALRYLATATGAAGLLLAIPGACALLVRRLKDPDLRVYTTPGDIFNLLFFIVALGLLLAGYLLRAPESPDAFAFARALLTFDTRLTVSPLLAAGLAATSLLIAYIPMTHMSHFIAKYFTYHSIRWDDGTVARKGKMAQKLAQYLTYRPTWAAPHIAGDGVKTWLEVATTNPTKGGEKK